MKRERPGSGGRGPTKTPTAKSDGFEGAKAEKSGKTKETRAGEQRKMGGQRSSNKEQEPSLAAHSEQLKTKNADRQTEKRGSNGRARRVYCKLAKAREGGGESRAGEEKVGRQEGGVKGGQRGTGGNGRAQGPKNTKKQQKGRGSRRQGPTSQAKSRKPGRGVGKWTQKTGVTNCLGCRRRIRWRVLEVTPKTPEPVASADRHY